MGQRDICILTDSGSDVPPEFAREHGMFTVPLTIKFSDGVYYDKETISPEEVYRRLPCEIPKTSLPPMERVLAVMGKVLEMGGKTLFCVTISGALSGTANLMRLAAREVPGLDCRFIDTKNIGIGAGLVAMRCAELIERGMDADSIETAAGGIVKSTKVFFCIPTLEYLIKGGRIGRVAAAAGTLLHILPIITCGPDGVYQAVQKARGEARAAAAAIANAAEYIKGRRYHLAVACGGPRDIILKVQARIRDMAAAAESCVFTDVSPALGVHTGPGLFGIGVQAAEQWG